MSNTPKIDKEVVLKTTVLFADLIEQWERRCVALDKLAKDVEKTASDETITRLKIKAGVTRAMTVELKREIRRANDIASCPLPSCNPLVALRESDI